MSDEIIQKPNLYPLDILKKQPPEVFYKKGVLKNFAEFTGNHLCQSFLLLQLYLKKYSCTGVSCEFYKIFNKTFFTEHLQPSASKFFQSTVNQAIVYLA